MGMEFTQRARAYLDEARRTLDRLPMETMERIFDVLCAAYRDDRQVLVMGNGGSAALASHFAVDLGKGTVAPGRPRFRVVSLVDNTPVMTAYANDLSYADVFSEQIRTLARPGDVVFGISGSGNSPNVLEGLKAAREAGASTVVLTGYQGGKAIGLADLCLVVPSDDMQHIENCHLALMHLYMQAMGAHVRERTAGRPSLLAFPGAPEPAA
ncbi:MAG TPA: SIS domain-containing protein [Candidatus Polarisedimenticolia bacterium]|nr:SIS domain-containing protein [Candidatus Polarisedimenticolia bacterium]